MREVYLKECNDFDNYNLLESLSVENLFTNFGNFKVTRDSIGVDNEQQLNNYAEDCRNELEYQINSLDENDTNNDYLKYVIREVKDLYSVWKKHEKLCIENNRMNEIILSSVYYDPKNPKYNEIEEYIYGTGYDVEIYFNEKNIIKNRISNFFNEDEILERKEFGFYEKY